VDAIFVTPVIFFVISFIFSMLGMGGGQLYTPILFWFGMDFKTQAIPLSLLLNLITTSSSSITYGLKKMIDWKVAIPFGVTMVAFAPLGTWLNVKLPTKYIIITPVIFFVISFAVFAASAAILMLRGHRPESGEISSKGKKILGISGGSGLGFLTGLTGLGGGAFVVPLLYMAGIDTKLAVATSALVATAGGASSILSRIFTTVQPEWSLWILNIVAVIIGSQVGSRVMVAKLKAKSVKTIFGWVLLAVSTVLLIQNFLK
jgi:uncharacterized membrane protein YfcA